MSELSGLETMEIMQRYAHLSVDHLAQSVASLTEVASAAPDAHRCNLGAGPLHARIGKSGKPLWDLARPAGIEPATPAFGGQYSIH